MCQQSRISQKGSGASCIRHRERVKVSARQRTIDMVTKKIVNNKDATKLRGRADTKSCILPTTREQVRGGLREEDVFPGLPSGEMNQTKGDQEQENSGQPDQEGRQHVYLCLLLSEWKIPRTCLFFFVGSASRAEIAISYSFDPDLFRTVYGILPIPPLSFVREYRFAPMFIFLTTTKH